MNDSVFCVESTLYGNTFLDEIDRKRSDPSTLLWAIVDGVLLVLILGGNLLTIIAIRTCRRLQSIISNCFILSLAISDLIVGFTLPYHLAFYLDSRLGESHILCLLKFFLIIFACCVSILTLISIAIDRYIAIVYALHYRRYMTRRKVSLIIAFGWFTGITVALIPMFWNHLSTATKCEFDQILPPWYMAGVITPAFVLVWLCMLMVYWRIVREASKHSRQLRESINGLQNTTSDWKSVQVVLFIMGCFSLCWLPYFIVACAQIFKIYTTSQVVYKGAFSLAMANSAVNPIIYAWKNSSFRQSFGQLLHCKSPNHCPNNQDASEYGTRPYYTNKQCFNSNNILVVAITPNNRRDGYHDHQNCISGITVQPAADHLGKSVKTEIHQTSVLAASLEIEDEEKGNATCAPCALCKNLLRISTQFNHNLIQQAIQEELANCFHGENSYFCHHKQHIKYNN